MKWGDVPMWLAIVGCLILSVRYYRHWKRVEREEAERDRMLRYIDENYPESPRSLP